MGGKLQRHIVYGTCACVNYNDKMITSLVDAKETRPSPFARGWGYARLACGGTHNENRRIRYPQRFNDL